MFVSAKVIKKKDISFYNSIYFAIFAKKNETVDIIYVVWYNSVDIIGILRILY